MYPRSLRFNMSYIIFISTIRSLNVCYLIGKKAFGTVFDETNTCKDAKRLDVKKKTIYRPQKHLKEVGSSKDRQRSGLLRNILAHKNCYFMTSSRRNHYQKARKVLCRLPDASGTRICSKTAWNRLV